MTGGVASVPALPSGAGLFGCTAGRPNVTTGCGTRSSVLLGAGVAPLPGHYSGNLASRNQVRPAVDRHDGRTTFEQPDADSVRAEHRQVVAVLEAKLPAAAGPG